ncbi:DUF1203 domain-containing protein [Halomontanus rarus]|uniref:DUF1203 domain-containing protein n=1 Tax=Halomontanus rarus TaxID=3034020 RepID=UPI003CE59F78
MVSWDRPLTLNGYRKGRRLSAQEYITDGATEPIIAQLFARHEIDYIHVRKAEAGY